MSVVINENIANTLISLSNDNELNQVKMSYIIKMVNVGGHDHLTPFELFLLGKELGSLYMLQCQTSTLSLTEEEIKEAINQVEQILKHK